MQVGSGRGALLERRRRAEAALVSVVATRRMTKLVATLGIDRLSKSQVSEMAEDPSPVTSCSEVYMFSCCSEPVGRNASANTGKAIRVPGTIEVDM